MKILKVLFVVVFILYIIGFFAIAPLKMLAVDTRSAPVMLVANEAYQSLYWSWIQHLDESNIIRVTWNRNGVYWCVRMEVCRAGTPSENTRQEKAVEQ